MRGYFILGAGKMGGDEKNIRLVSMVTVYIEIGYAMFFFADQHTPFTFAEFTVAQDFGFYGRWYTRYTSLVDSNVE